MKPKHKGIESLKSKYGWGFISTWIIGTVLFFIFPVFQSMIFSFSDVAITSDGIQTEFVGLKHYTYILLENTEYLGWLRKSLIQFLYSLPIIVLLSMVLALLLNQNFKGRLFFRALYFVPVIIATGTVLKMISGMNGGDMSSSSVNDTLTGNMFSVEDVVELLDLPNSVAVYAQQIITNIFDLIWNSGIQTVLFLAGLQSIPSSFYEASRVEGATKWEEFWFITFPMLSNVTLLVSVFTMIELFVNNRTRMITEVYSLMRSAVYDQTSAMLWFYFIIVGVIMIAIIWAYRNFLQKKWN